MQDVMWTHLIEEIRKTGVMFDSGLTDTEIANVEARYHFQFPPDLRAFLQTGQPRGENFPDWRSDDVAMLRDWLDLPRRGILFDIKHNGFWLEEWGPQPQSLEDAERIANELVAAAPQLIPVYAHRMIPARPHLNGNPVFSVHQTDIIIYGVDLHYYMMHEFLTCDDAHALPNPKDVRQIAFWCTLTG